MLSAYRHWREISNSEEDAERRRKRGKNRVRVECQGGQDEAVVQCGVHPDEDTFIHTKQCIQCTRSVVRHQTCECRGWFTNLWRLQSVYNSLCYVGVLGAVLHFLCCISKYSTWVSNTKYTKTILIWQLLGCKTLSFFQKNLLNLSNASVCNTRDLTLTLKSTKFWLKKLSKCF